MAEDLDYYVTPEYVTDVLLDREEFGKTVWEPACGNGAIAKVLRRQYKIRATDIMDRGFGEVEDFFESRYAADSIVT